MKVRKNISSFFMLGVWVFLLALLGSILTPPALLAQGCIIAHSVGEVGGPLSEGGYLQQGHWQLSIDYRHQYSFLHFVGSTEQVYRTQTGTEVRNRINLVDQGLTYQATPRWSFFFNAPVELASRRYNIPADSLGNNKPGLGIIGDYGISGFGDISFTPQVWLWNPNRNPRYNIQLGKL